MKRFLMPIVAAFAIANLTGCVTDLVALPVKVAYGTGKLAVKGTAAAVRAVVPNAPDHEYQKCLRDQEKDERIYCENLKPTDD